MKNHISKSISIVTMLAAGLFTSLSATAGLITTPVQTQTFSFLTPSSSSTVLAFNGFDSTLGTLNSVHFSWTLDQTLNDQVYNFTGAPQLVGNVLPLSATATTNFTGQGIAALLTGTNTMTTPGFSGTVAAGGPTTVGTVSATGIIGGVCLSNDASCGAGNTSLSAYVGGLNLFTVNLDSIGFQSGTVPGGVFTGNSGIASGTVSIFYDYTAAKVPVPATSALMFIGLLGMMSLRRRV